ncbi:hypothetical protein ACFS32_16805 [Novosphingobium pokkalii]|uniref:hypothetical protein n=1 Tax=Novosphingobium pokkalii TaxID=1770194 RepID=UPI00363D4213
MAVSPALGQSAAPATAGAQNGATNGAGGQAAMGQPGVPAALPGSDAFAQIPFFADGALSPDGTRIAGKFGIGGTQVIGIRNLFDTTEKPVQLAVPDQTEADWVHWVGNDYVLVKLRALVPLGQGDRGYVTRLIAIERATGKVTRILWNLGGRTPLTCCGRPATARRKSSFPHSIRCTLTKASFPPCTGSTWRPDAGGKCKARVMA